MMVNAPYAPLPDKQLRSQWFQHFARYERPDAAFDKALAVYRSPGRYYHTIEHGLEVATTARELAADLPATEVDELCLAAWLHDAHFEVDADDNEERSARLAEQSAVDLGMEPTRARRVADLVRASSHTVRPNNELQATMCDADLATLAKPWDAYMADVANIRAELQITDDEKWRSTRLDMLGFFERKVPLYHRTDASLRWEESAVANRLRERDLLNRS